MKEAKIRHLDNDGYRHRAACICIRDDREDEVSFDLFFFFLLIRMKNVSLLGFIGHSTW